MCVGSTCPAILPGTYLLDYFTLWQHCCAWLAFLEVNSYFPLHLQLESKAIVYWFLKEWFWGSVNQCTLCYFELYYWNGQHHYSASWTQISAPGMLFIKAQSWLLLSLGLKQSWKHIPPAFSLFLSTILAKQYWWYSWMFYPWTMAIIKNKYN